VVLTRERSLKKTVVYLSSTVQSGFNIVVLKIKWKVV